MKTKDELMAELLIERQDQTWWRTTVDPLTRSGDIPAGQEAAYGSMWDDSPLTRARRRRDLVRDAEQTTDTNAEGRSA